MRGGKCGWQSPLAEAAEGHVVSCCLEMLSFVLLILALRRYINFHIFAGGPLTFLVNSGVIETRYIFFYI